MAVGARRSRSSRPRDPARPSWVFGSIRELRQDPLGTLMRAFAEHGDVAPIRLGPPRVGRTLYLVSHPGHVEHVLKTNQANYKKAPTYLPIRAFLGEGLLTSEGDTWLRHRRLAQRSFYRNRLDGFVELMADACADVLARWEARPDRSPPVEVAQEMSSLTLTVVGRALFGIDLSREGSKVAPALAEVQRHIVDRIALTFAPRALGLVERVPSPRNRRYRRAVAALDELVWEIIESRRSSSQPEGDDLLGSLMAASDEEGRSLSDREIRDEVMTFVLAGHETTANALTWTFYLLSKHPSVADELSAEAARVLGGRNPTREDIDKLELTGAVVKEAMRLYPPAWIIEREAIEEDEIGGRVVEAGAVVATSPYVTHRHPRFWDNPEGFDPRRFLDGGENERPPFAYFPFGGGRRQCIGAGFALLEATVILAMVAARFRLHLVPGHDVALDPEVTLRAQNGILMTPRRV